MPSCSLYYGPGARQAAIDEANRVGYLMAPPFGDEGLKVDEAREVVNLLFSTPVGVKIGTVVVGPMDIVQPKVSDVLLKKIEEFDDKMVQPVLWAYDASGVSPTIRSRCLSKWVPIGEDRVDQALISAGSDLVRMALEGEFYAIPELVGKFRKKEHDLLDSISEELSMDVTDPRRIKLWGRVRAVAAYRNPTDTEIIAALVEGDLG